MKKLIYLKDKEGRIIGGPWKTYRAAAYDLNVTAQLVNYICNGTVKHSYKVQGQLEVKFLTDEEAALSNFDNLEDIDSTISVNKKVI